MAHEILTYDRVLREADEVFRLSASMWTRTTTNTFIQLFNSVAVAGTHTHTFINLKYDKDWALYLAYTHISRDRSILKYGHETFSILFVSRNNLKRMNVSRIAEHTQLRTTTECNFCLGVETHACEL